MDSREYWSSEKYYKRKLYCHKTYNKNELTSNKIKCVHLIIRKALQNGIRSNYNTYAEPMPCRASRSKPRRTGSSRDGNGGRCKRGTQNLCRSGPPRPPPSGRARPTPCRSGTYSSPEVCLKKPRKIKSCNIAVSKWNRSHWKDVKTIYNKKHKRKKTKMIFLRKLIFGITFERRNCLECKKILPSIRSHFSKQCRIFPSRVW